VSQGGWVNFLSRTFSWALLFLTLPLLFLPKVNLISLDPEETAGFRLDDLILFITGILLLWVHALSDQSLDKIEGWILSISMLAFFSFLANRLLVSMGVIFMDAKIFYAFRLLEYFLFFYIGALASQFFQARTIILPFLLWNFLLMTFQKLNVVGGIVSEGYHADVSSRVQGIAAFPSEMGLLLNLLFCYLIFDDSTRSGWVNRFHSPFRHELFSQLFLYGLFFLFAIFIIFTGNRISIVAVFVSFLFRLKKELSSHFVISSLCIAFFIPLVVLVISVIMIHTPGVYNRSFDLFSFKNLELFPLVWDQIDITQHPMASEGTFVEDYDMSWWLRIHKWLFMAKTYFYTPQCYLQGLGPGYAGAALDGGFLRILTEYGLIGVFLFWKFFSLLYRLNAQTQGMLIAFSINMIFFDAYLAYKTMSFLLLACGYIHARSTCKEDPVPSIV